MEQEEGDPLASTTIVIPTYNERENIQRIVPALLNVAGDLNVLVVDDSSPDGTADAVRQMSTRDPRVTLLLREERVGIGPAYLAGFRHVLSTAAELVIQMDADFSHPVEMIPRFIEEMDGHDVVLGSRYQNGITVVNWPIERLLLSYFGNSYARWVTRMPIRDVTGGFKCWRRSVLEAIPLGQVRSNGYAFQIEMTYRAWRLGCRIREVPIIFMDRTVGDSKMNKRIAMEALWIVWWLRLMGLMGRL